MSQFKPIETSSLITFQLIFQNLLVEVYGVLVNVFFKLYSNSCCVSKNLSDDIWVTILIQFEVPSKTFTFYLLFTYMVNIVLNS